MHHDIRRIFDAINCVYFSDLLDIKVEWFRCTSPRKESRQGMHYGYYQVETNTIRINPCLDQSFVPQYFMGYLLFHEACHSFIPPELVRGPDGKPRLEWHTTSFYRAEARFAHIKRAQHWEQANLDRLLRADARTHKARKAAHEAAYGSDHDD